MMSCCPLNLNLLATTRAGLATWVAWPEWVAWAEWAPLARSRSCTRVEACFHKRRHDLPTPLELTSRPLDSPAARRPSASVNSLMGSAAPLIRACNPTPAYTWPAHVHYETLDCSPICSDNFARLASAFLFSRHATKHIPFCPIHLT